MSNLTKNRKIFMVLAISLLLSGWLLPPVQSFAATTATNPSTHICTGEVRWIKNIKGELLFALYEEPVVFQLTSTTSFESTDGSFVSIYSAESVLPKRAVEIQYAQSASGTVIVSKVKLLTDESLRNLRQSRPAKLAPKIQTNKDQRSR